MADTNYQRGEMDINAHETVFGGFMNYSIYGGAAIIVILLFPILIFGVGMAWLTSLVISVALGIAIGIGLKFRGAWYAALIGTALFLAVAIWLLTLLF